MDAGRDYKEIFFIVALTVLGTLTGCSGKQDRIETQDGIRWMESYEEGLKSAAQEDRPVLLYFWASWCPWCRKMDSKVFPAPDVIKVVSENFVPVKLDVNSGMNEPLKVRYHFRGTPTFVVVDREGRILWSRDEKIAGYHIGYMDKGEYLQFLGTFIG